MSEAEEPVVETEPTDTAPTTSLLLTRVLADLGDLVVAHHDRLGDDTIVIASADRLTVARYLFESSELAMDMLMDSTGVDYDEREPRFEVVDHFFSTRAHHRLRVRSLVDEDELDVPSLCPLYGSANWMERETYDMYGICFTGHPDLRRILLYPEFVGHPLRKDYDKMHAQPLFEERYPGVRETSTVIHPEPGDQEPIHAP